MYHSEERRPCGTEESLGAGHTRIAAAAQTACERPVYTLRLSMPLVALTIFLSAFLLFQVQPVISKFILPWFGGAPAVWTACMLFFQVGLFGGYLYAHLLCTRVRPAVQHRVHLALLCLAVLQLPLAISQSWKPVGGENSLLRITLMLAATVGLPYFVLSSTNPLLGAWLGASGLGRKAYRYYALSNLGSLCALLSYPFVIEPRLSGDVQTTVWSAGFGLFAVCSAGVVVRMQHTTAPSACAAGAARPRALDYLFWTLASACGSTLLLATTNYVCLDLAVVPLLWVLPLALYLLTFIICFEHERWYRRRPILVLFAALLLAALLTGRDLQIEGRLLIAGCLGVMFCGCLLCHGELARSKPAAPYLTWFYLASAFGGMLGGFFVSAAAPHLFTYYLEFPFALMSCPALVFAAGLRAASKQKGVSGRAGWIILTPFAVPVALTIVIALPLRQGVDNARSFFGAVHVALRPDALHGGTMVMLHGSTLHGAQFQAAEYRRVPTLYYSERSGAGILLRHFRTDRPRRIGIIGLGTGTLAAYARPGDQVTFFEIDPLVVQMAKQHFTWLADSPAGVNIMLGDGRLSLERLPDSRFDVLVLDAFNSDSIPVHLLTLEAFEIYLSRLAPGGVIAVHISNRYLDLTSICERARRRLGLQAAHVSSPGDDAWSAIGATWFLISADPRSLSFPELLAAATEVTLARPGEPWTDLRNNLFDVLVR